MPCTRSGFTPSADARSSSVISDTSSIPANNTVHSYNCFTAPWTTCLQKHKSQLHHRNPTETRHNMVAKIWHIKLNLSVCSLFSETSHISQQISTFGMRHSSMPTMVIGMAFYLFTHIHNRFTALWILSRITRVSRYRNVKPIWILLKQETVSGRGISWAISKSASCPR